MVGWLLSFAGDCRCDLGQLEVGVASTCVYMDVNNQSEYLGMAVSGRYFASWVPHREVTNQRMGDLVPSRVAVPLWMLFVLSAQGLATAQSAMAAGRIRIRDIGAASGRGHPGRRASWFARIALIALVLAGSFLLMWWILGVVLLWLFDLWAWLTFSTMPPKPYVLISVGSALVAAIIFIRRVRYAMRAYTAHACVLCPCLQCGYDLRQNLSGRCPECGLSFGKTL